MHVARVSRGTLSTPTFLMLNGACVLGLILVTLLNFREWLLLNLTVITLMLVTGIELARRWLNRETTLISDGETVRIDDGPETLFHGRLRDTKAIGEDDRGYCIHLDNKEIIRVRRKDIPGELQEMFKTEKAQQDAEVKRGRRLH